MRALTLLLIVATTSGCFLFARPNPRLKKIERSKDSNGDVTFKYDDAGHPTSVTHDPGDGQTTTYTLSWDDAGLITKIVRAQKIQDATVKTTQELAWDDDKRLVKSVQKDDDTDSTYVLTYDDAGHLEKLTLTQKSNGNTFTREESFAYDDAGVLTKHTTSTTFGDGEPQADAFTYTYEDGRLSKLASGDGKTDVETQYDYDDSGKLTDIDETASNEESSSSRKTAMDYGDDGRVTSITTSAGELELESKLAYDDGDAQGVDMSPLGFLWDANGKGYTDMAPTFVPRFLGLDW